MEVDRELNDLSFLKDRHTFLYGLRFLKDRPWRMDVDREFVKHSW